MPNSNPLAIIDVGSNSVRLVVYSGPRRAPFPVLNEKVLAGLGSAVESTGSIAQESWDRAIAALERFRLLLRHMGVRRPQLVATAAVRDADNGPALVRIIKSMGFDCRVLEPEEEARLAGLGVISAIPAADGLVGDLGGGSLELVDVAGGDARQGMSLPLGVLRLSTDRSGQRKAREILRQALKGTALAEHAAGRTFYMVGGSWRALARLEMLETDYPLPITHQYRIDPSRAADLAKAARSLGPRQANVIPSARQESLPAAAMLLELLIDELRPSALVFSSAGIREGLIYDRLSPRLRREDPLLATARALGQIERRIDPHGDVLSQWIGHVFDDPPELQRIRHAACLLADAAWQASSDFRASRAIELALHGNWLAVDVADRVLMAQALSSTFGRDKQLNESLLSLCKAEHVQRARQWGAGIRLGQRLCGGVGAILGSTRLKRSDDALVLCIRESDAGLVDKAVQRRLSRLADLLGCTCRVEVL